MLKKSTLLLMLICSLSTAFSAGSTAPKKCNRTCSKAVKPVPMDNIAISRISIDYFL